MALEEKSGKILSATVSYLGKLKDQLINKGKDEQKEQLCFDGYFFGVSMSSVYFHSTLKTFANVIDYGY